jgi:phosphatidylglycerophosphatase A
LEYDVFVWFDIMQKETPDRQQKSIKAVQALAEKVGWFYVVVTTGCFAGYAPFDPGTAGTIVAIPLYLVLVWAGWFPYLIGMFLLFVVGIQGAHKIEQATDKTDNGIIVIDEVVGYLTTMVFLPRQWVYIIIGFGVFRLFDCLKPYPIRKFDKNPKFGGFGVMIDDVLAGVYGNMVLQILVMAMRFGSK